MDAKTNTTHTIPWWALSLGEREKELVCQVIESNFPNEGDYTTRFEQNIAEICQVPYAIATTSGTSAIFLALAACGVGPGDQVIVPDITFIATANAVKLTGATPILVDVSADSFNVNPEQVEMAITPRTKAVVPVHVSGRAAKMPALMEIARRHNLCVVEDAAEALGSHLNGRPLGSFGNAGCFSFSPNKTITTGQGGMVVTSDVNLYRRLKELKDHGRPTRGTGGDDVHHSLGYNFKLTNIQAAIGLAQLEKFPARQEHLRQIYRIYRDQLADVPGVRLPGFNLEGGECPQWVDASVEHRDRLYDYLLANNVHTRKFWFPIHTQAPYRASDDGFSTSITVSRKAIWLSSALSLTEEDVYQVCGMIKKWSRQNEA